jgi:hypothetical protein
MVASVLGTPIGSLLSISYSIQREKAGIYTCGSPDPRSVSRGKRGIAGSLIFQVFNQDVLYQIIYNHRDEFLFWTRTSNKIINDVSGAYGVDDNGNGTLNDWKKQSLAYGAYTPFYADQIPPFDISLTFLNELGNLARMDVRGVELLNEGMGISVEDMAIEQAMTFIARSVGKMVPGADGRVFVDSHIIDNLDYPNVP